MRRSFAAGLVSLVVLSAATAHADCTTTPALCNLTVTSTIEEPDLDQAIDVVLVGDGFIDAPSWASAAASAIATFKAQNATGLYGSVPGLFNFHVVTVISATTDVTDADQSDTALGMSVGGPYITSDSSRVITAALNAPDVDLTIAIGNGSGRANANYPTGLASGGSVRLGSSYAPISHELGHALIHLTDEYVEAGLCTSTPSEAVMVSERNVTTDPSCLKFSTTAGAGCVQGARYCATGAYRSASSCLMASSGNTTPCPVCRRAILETLLEKQSNVDRAEPWAVVTSPAAGALLVGSVTFAAILYDDTFAPTRVSFVIDGVFKGSASAASTFVQFPFDTRTLSDGAHTLRVFPDDLAGHAGLGSSVTFQTQNFTVGAPPTLAIRSPLNGAVVGGTSFLNGDATGSTPAWLALLVDGRPLAISVNSKTIFAQWNTLAETQGSHLVELKGADVLQAMLAAPPVTVTVSQPTDGGSTGGQTGGGLFVSTSAPQPWSGVGPSFLLKYFVFGAAGSVSPELFVDGVAVTPNPLPLIPAQGPQPEATQQVVLIDSAAWALGPHQLQVRVSTPQGNAQSVPLALVRVAPGSSPVALLRAPVAGASVRGTVPVLASAFDDVAVASLTLWVDGVAGPSRTGSTATFMWNTTALTEGQHTLRVRATDAASNQGDSELVTVTVDNTPPTLLITSPLAGTVPAALMPVHVANSGAVAVELWVDGALRASVSASNGVVVLPVILTPGPHTLQAWGVDGAGNSGQSASVPVNAASCGAGTCDDGKSCTVDSCGTSGACVHLPTAECCTTAADCGDGDTCTADTCNAGTCAHATVAGCCNFGFGCNDAVACTLDACSGPGGTCSHPAGDCCATPADCNDGNSCTTDACLPGGRCITDWAGSCCRTTLDCDDNDVCTTETCNAGTCGFTPVAACCNTGADCDDQRACTSNQCVNHACVFNPIAGCCGSAADCTSLDACVTGTCNASSRCQSTRTANCCTFASECDDRDACTLDSCAGSSCQHTQVCCSASNQCNDANACTTDSCDLVAGRCQFAAMPGCCATAADCDDQNACTAEACTGSLCSSTPIAACCLSAADCDDADLCTVDACAGNGCTHARTPTCCTTAAGCDDANLCTVDTCNANVCVSTPTSGCCVSAADCSDNDACTSDACVNNACTHGAVAGCCASAAQCDDADACTTDACANNACTHLRSCCSLPADCDDGVACTVDTCNAGTCGHAPAAGCCATAGDCDDQDPCTDESCTAGQCASVPRAACCVSSAQCDDGDTCTQDACTANACSHLAGCCTVDSECDDARACTTDRCEQGMCVRDAVAGCCATDADCDDGDACSADRCSGATCSRDAVSGCCHAAADCEAGQACVNQVCVAESGPPDAAVVGKCGCSSGGLGLLLPLALAFRRRRRPHGAPAS